MKKMTEFEKFELKILKKELKNLMVNIMKKVSFKLRNLHVGEENQGLEIIDEEFQKINKFIEMSNETFKNNLEKYIIKDLMTERYFLIRNIFTQEEMEEKGMIEEFKPYIKNL